MGLFGKSSAEKAADRAAAEAKTYRNSAIQTQQDELGRMINGSQEMLGSYNGLLNPLLMQLYGGDYFTTGDMSSGSNQAAYNAVQSYLDALTGKTPLAEQSQLDSLAQNYMDQLTGKNKSAEQQKADEWGDQYLSLLQNSPDTAFNAGVARLTRSIQDSKNIINNEAAKRGITGSGVALSKLGGTEGDRARGMSALQGQRVNDKLNATGAAVDFTQKRADRVANNNASAVDLANNLYTNKLNNLANAANTANSYNQQNINNIMNMLSGKGNSYQMTGNASSNLAGAQSQAASNQLGIAQNYANIASSENSAIGNLVGGIISGGLGLGAAKLIGGK